VFILAIQHFRQEIVDSLDQFWIDGLFRLGHQRPPNSLCAPPSTPLRPATTAAPLPTVFAFSPLPIVLAASCNCLRRAGNSCSQSAFLVKYFWISLASLAWASSLAT